MRALTDKETHTLFSKLANYTGRSLNDIIMPSQQDGSGDASQQQQQSENDRYVFRLHGSRVYYVKLSLANLATSVPRDNLLSLGTCMGKFTKTGKFRLHITSLEVIAPHARYKVWIKKNGEMPFLYGGNLVKAHIGRWSEDCPEHQGVVVMNMDDAPLGFGVTAKSTAEIRRLEPTGIATFRQADIGEYLREVCLRVSSRYGMEGREQPNGRCRKRMLILLYRKIPFSHQHSALSSRCFSWVACCLYRFASSANCCHRALRRFHLIQKIPIALILYIPLFFRSSSVIHPSKSPFFFCHIYALFPRFRDLLCCS